MHRREFLRNSLALSSALMLPGLLHAQYENRRLKPLLLGSNLISPASPWFSKADELYRYSQEKGLTLLTNENDIPPVGSQLHIDFYHQELDGHHFALVHDGKPLYIFVSEMIGSLYERGEPLVAEVSGETKFDQLRVDIWLGRQLVKGEVLPLYNQQYPDRGVSAQLKKEFSFEQLKKDKLYQLEAIEKHIYTPFSFISEVVKPESVNIDDTDGYDSAKIKIFPRDYWGLNRIPAKREYLFNPSPWPDMGPYAIAIKDGRKIIGYIERHFLAFLSMNLKFPLVHGERIDVKIIGEGNNYPRQVFVQPSLIA